MAAAATRSDARHALLARLIDHAPTFPPASLAAEDALAEDRRAAESAVRFVLARLVWPASRWAELGDYARAVSVVGDGDLPRDPRVEAVELRHPGSLDGLAELAPEVYVELPPDAAAELAAFAAAGLRAKVRCGGERVPGVEELAAFVRGCRAAGIPFKATAGLHHAVRTGAQHGLLNLLAAAVFPGDEEAALDDAEPDAFRVAADGFGWRGRRAGSAEVARARRGLLVSVGSCSFFEPVEELAALGIL